MIIRIKQRDRQCKVREKVRKAKKAKKVKEAEKKQKNFIKNSPKWVT